jgi:hypothetical protein
MSVQNQKTGWRAISTTLDAGISDYPALNIYYVSSVSNKLESLQFGGRAIAVQQLPTGEYAFSAVPLDLPQIDESFSIIEGYPRATVVTNTGYNVIQANSAGGTIIAGTTLIGDRRFALNNIGSLGLWNTGLSASGSGHFATIKFGNTPVMIAKFSNIWYLVLA